MPFKRCNNRLIKALLLRKTGDGSLSCVSTEIYRQGTVLCLVNKLLKTNGTVFDVAGVGADFISEMQDGNNILGAAILAAGHFATTAVINMVLSATFIWLGIPVLALSLHIYISAERSVLRFFFSILNFILHLEIIIQI